jgi:hypothetical protein
MFEYKFNVTHEEKIEFRSKLFNFLERLHLTYGDKIPEDIKPVIDNKKRYKHEYYMRNRDKYKKKKDINAS